MVAASRFLRKALQLSFRPIKPTMVSYVQIVSSGTPSNDPLLLLFCDDRRYLFNCGENTQRFSGETKVRLSRVEHIFLARTKWSSIGGLQGVLMTMSDGFNEQTKIQLVGPPNLSHAISTARSFVNRANLKVSVLEVAPPLNNAQVILSDSNVTISAVRLQPNNIATTIDPHLERKRLVAQAMFSGQFSRFESNEPRSPSPPPSENQAIEPKQKKLRWKQSWIETPLEPYFPDSSALVFIAKMANLPGKFDVKRAAELGVPKGPLYSQLVKGAKITLEDGREVSPRDCVGPPRPGEVFIVVTCPDVSYIQSILQSNDLQSESFGASGVSCILHCCPIEVLQNEQYIQWTTTFGEKTQHIIVNEECCRGEHIHRSSTLNQIRLNSIAPDLFLSPLVSHDKLQPIPTAFPRNTVPAEGMMRFMLAPGATKIERQDDTKAFEAEVQAILEDIQARQDLQDYRQLAQEQGNSSWRLSCLGTGSSIPSKYRNVSCSQLEIGDSSVLFDAGEGSLSQWLRITPYHEREQRIRSINTIFISHMHADHVLGLINVLLYRQRIGAANPPTVIGPYNLLRFLSEYSVCEPLQYEFIDAVALIKRPMDLPGGASASAVFVKHIAYSFGFILHAKGQKFVYSGDTRPCEALTSAGLGADLLIHEATFEDEMANEAKHKRHSTVSEAIAVATKMQAKQVLLTHFSQRYPKRPANLNIISSDEQTDEEGSLSIPSSSAAPLQDFQIAAENTWERTGLAFDLLTVSSNTFSRLVSLKPLFASLFPDDSTD